MHKYSSKLSIFFIFIFFIAIFFTSCNMAIYIYRLLPCSSLLQNIGSTSITQRPTFLSAITNTPIGRNRNFVRLPIAIGVAMLRRVIPPLNTFLNQRASQSGTSNIENPSVIDLHIPPFNFENIANANNYITARDSNKSIRNFISGFLFMVVFLMCIVFLTGVFSLCITLVGNATRGTYKISNLVKEEVDLLSKEQEDVKIKLKDLNDKTNLKDLNDKTNWIE